MDQRHYFVAQNVDILRQGIGLVNDLSDELYAKNGHEYFDSGIGRHLRHALDLYQCFLERTGDTIDYDARERDERVETEQALVRPQTDLVLLR